MYVYLCYLLRLSSVSTALIKLTVRARYLDVYVVYKFFVFNALNVLCKCQLAGEVCTDVAVDLTGSLSYIA